MRRILAALLAPIVLLSMTAVGCDSKPKRDQERAPRPDSVVPVHYLAPEPTVYQASYGASAAITGPDSTVKLKARVYLGAALLASDTLRFDYLRNDSLQKSQRSLASLDSAFVGAPAYGGTAKYSVCVQVERNGRSSGVVSTKSCWATPWTYTRPMPPLANPDSIVRVALRPARGTMITAVARWMATSVPTAENQAQVCAFGVTAAGRKVKLKNSWNSEPCDSAFRTWLAER